MRYDASSRGTRRAESTRKETPNDWKKCEERVTFNTPEEDGKFVYKCQGLARAAKNQRRGCLDLVPYIFFAKDGCGHTRDRCATCWTEHNES